MRREFRFLLFAALLSSSLTFSHISHMVKGNQTALVRVIPSTIELGPEEVVGQIITVAVVIEDVVDLSGIAVILSYDPAYLTYVAHTLTVPVETYSSVQPPSPYAGMLHPFLFIPVEPPPQTPGTLEFSVGGSTPPFNGSGTFFVATLEVTDQPQPREEDIILSLHFSSVDLVDSQTSSISHQVQDGTVTIYAPEPEQPPSPPVGGISTSIDFGKFSSWITSTLLIVAAVITLNVKWNRRRRKH